MDRSSERNLFRKLWPHLKAGDTIVADSGFCCWFTLSLFNQRGVRVVMCKSTNRKPDPRAKRLGRGDLLERWKKPPIRPKWLSLSAYDQMPGSILVRTVKEMADPGICYRTTELHLASTVPDPKQMSAVRMGDIYLSRWQMELFIDDLKTTPGMGILTTRSPAMIRRELIVHIVAYNLLLVLMKQGKESNASSPSFKGTLNRFNQWLPILQSATSAATRKRFVEDLIELIAEDQPPPSPLQAGAQSRQKEDQTLPTPSPATRWQKCRTAPATKNQTKKLS